jgi:archaellum component FlaC
MSKKELYQKKIEGRLQELKDEIIILKTRVDNAKNDVQLEYLNQIEKLKKLEKEAEEKLSEFKQKGDDSWESFKESVEHNWDKLSDEITNLKKKFKDEESSK